MKLCRVNENVKRWIWGYCPLPANAVVILANTDVTSSTYGILVQYASSGMYGLAAGRAVRTIKRSIAESMITDLCVQELQEQHGITAEDKV